MRWLPVVDDAGRGCGNACIPAFMSRYFFTETRCLMPNKVFMATVVSLTDDKERTQSYRVSEVSELRAEEVLQRYLRDRDEKIISVRIREATRSEAASLNLASGRVKLSN
jgi:hypothetical protein